MERNEIKCDIKRNKIPLSKPAEESDTFRNVMSLLLCLFCSPPLDLFLYYSSKQEWQLCFPTASSAQLFSVYLITGAAEDDVLSL